jgi:hypothetical protein
MMNHTMKRRVFLPAPPAAAQVAALFALCIVLSGFAGAEPLYSPSWGFRIDPPADYAVSGGDRKNTFLFATADGLSLDLTVYADGTGRTTFTSAGALANDVKRRLNSAGAVSVFEYRRKQAAILELSFSIVNRTTGRPETMTGWGLAVELEPPQAAGTGSGAGSRPSVIIRKPLLLALAYGPEGAGTGTGAAAAKAKTDLQALHLSALDSIAPASGDRRAPGPVTDFSHPRKTRTQLKLAGLDTTAWFYAEDADAAQALVDREFAVLRRYADAPTWKEAWARFYRAIYRDSSERLADAAFTAERALNVPPRDNRDFAARTLQWIQTFTYERDLLGSDFVNLVSAITQGRGDCDSRALLWALILNQADIPAAIMVSRQFNHAMGLADLPGAGARLTIAGKPWLVAETTANVTIGLIGERVSNTAGWQSIALDYQITLTR